MKKHNWRAFRFNDGTETEVSLLEKDKKSPEYSKSYYGYGFHCTRRGVIRKIGKIIEWLYDHGVDGTQVLSAAYPMYEWRAIKHLPDQFDEKALLKLLKNHDFAWQYQSALILAKSRRRKKKFFSFIWIADIIKSDGIDEFVMKHSPSVCHVVHDIRIDDIAKDPDELYENRPQYIVT